MAPKGFERRKGTTNHGTSYEQKIAALLGVRCALDDDIEEMWMGTNIDGLGAFDDLVLFLQKKSASSISKEVYLIQVKYNGRKELSNLQKYQESFVEIRKDFSKSPLSDYCEFEDIKFLLFTKAKIVASNDVTLSEYQNSNDFINTGKMFQISSINYDHDFLKQTLLYSNQVDVSKVQTIIKNETDKYFMNCNVEAIIKFFETWHSEYFENKMALEKEDIRSFMLETMLSNYIPEPKTTEFPKASIWNEVASQFQFAFVKKEDNLTKIWQAVNLQMCNCFDDQSTDLLKWNEPLEQPSSKVNKIKQYFQKIQPPIRKDKSSYNIKDLYLLLWHVCELPLILNLNVNIDSQKDIYVALSKLHSSKSNRRYIFLGEVTGDFDQYSTHFNFLRIDRDIQETVLKNSYVSLQGKEAVTLEKLKLSDAALETISPELIIELLQPITKKAEAGDFYIPRFIRQPVVSLNVLLIPNVVFVILTGGVPINYHVLNRFGITMPWYMYNLYASERVTTVGDKNFDPGKIKNIILNKDAISSKECKYIEDNINKVRKCRDQTVHYLRFLDKNKLEWLHSTKNTDQVKPFLVSSPENYLPDSRLFYYLTFNILSGNTGEGKSTLLKFLADNSPADVWVIKLNIREVDEYIEKGEFSEIEMFLYHQSIEHFNGFNQFSLELFQSLYDELNILIIIDGIDEVEYNVNIENFLDAIKTLGIKTIIATRPSLKSTLEKKFQMPLLLLKPFTNEDCKSLMKLTLQNNYDEEEAHIKLILAKISQWNNAVGVPLLLKLFLSLLKDGSLLDFKKFDISDLFDRYIREQLTKLKSYSKFTIRTLSRSALFVLYKENAISELFVIEEYLEDIEEKMEVFIKSNLFEKHNNNNIPVFAHKSLAEFLTAKYLSELTEKPVRDVFHKFFKSLFYEEMETVRLFFDIITLKGSGLQDIITGNNPTDLCNKINKDLVDKFGRHSLHIAASYGHRCELRTTDSLWSGVRIYESYNNVPFNNTIQPCQKFERRTVMPLNFVRSLLDKDLDPFKRDNLYKMDVFEFAMESGSLEIIEVLFSKNFVKQLEIVNTDILLFHIVKDGHVNIFKELENKNFSLKILPAMDSLLHIALSSEKLDMINKFTNGEIPIDEPNVFKYTPLISWLTSSKLVNSNEYLLSSIINRNSPLNINQLNILNHLIDKKVNLNAVIIFGETPLHTFCGSQEQSVIELLIRNGAEVNRKSNLGAIPLHHASQFSIENVKLLVKHGSIIDISNFQGFTPLCCAVENNKIDIVKYLISKGANVNRSKTEVTPLNVAVSKGHLDCARLLLEKHAKINNTQINNTLAVAVASGSSSCVNLLLENKAKAYKELFHLAISLNQKQVIKFLLSKKVHINTNTDLNKLLFQAIPTADIDLIDILISHGADVNAKDTQTGDNPLHAACFLGLQKVVEHLSKHKSVINMENNNAQTPVIVAAETGNLEILKILCNNGSDLPKYGSNALYLAARGDHSDVVDYLISTGVDVNGTDSNGRAPIHHASGDNLYYVKYLIRKGANSNLKTVNEGFTPLMIAGEKGLLDVVQYLTADGATVNEEDTNRRTALSFASQGGHLECVKYLINKGSDVYKYGPHAICAAAIKEGTITVDYLISAGADINGIIERGGAPIHLAISERSLEGVKCLLNKGADINLKTVNEGFTPLMIAATNGFREIVEYLIKNGAKVNEENLIGSTSLIGASLWGYLECVKFLIGSGSDVDKYGPLAIYLAAFREHTTVVDYLLSAGADINGIIDNDMAPIHQAILRSDLKLVKYLISKGADINLKTLSECRTPLMLGAFKGRKEIVEYLVENGAKLNVGNKNGHTALIIASQEGHLDCVKFLVDKGSDMRKFGSQALDVATLKGHTVVANYLSSYQEKM